MCTGASTVQYPMLLGTSTITAATACIAIARQGGGTNVMQVSRHEANGAEVDTRFEAPLSLFAAQH